MFRLQQGLAKNKKYKGYFQPQRLMQYLYLLYEG